MVGMGEGSAHACQDPDLAFADLGCLPGWEIWNHAHSLVDIVTYALREIACLICRDERGKPLHSYVYITSIIQPV